MSFDILESMSRHRIPTEIIHGLFVGNYSASRNRDFIEQKKITHILTVAKDIDPEYPSNCIYKIVDVDDWHEEDLSKYFLDCFQFIEQGIQRGGVLVHCLAGISRSPTIVIGYLMWKEGMSLAEAYNYVKERRPNIGPNQGFLEQLTQFEHQLNIARASKQVALAQPASTSNASPVATAST